MKKIIFCLLALVFFLGGCNQSEKVEVKEKDNIVVIKNDDDIIFYKDGFIYIIDFYKDSTGNHVTKFKYSLADFKDR